ncbi:MAG: hypothetical protein JGK17_22130 [Microcoleus sp. PH2017_10_PVI_O_A]|nr:hypothetical protein [Microcoleus sp. PH2017_10_PVI_O_A]MCC3462330.1 hypothetical protein [Microcoleus sp. PH2017_11_PCY_U_A]MCC3480781.1 hypothetical protein [Microcoleus sp. PH2017_12_PCY_D_A]MCC3530708.1 hypothetical protein [Microcoleus sp. PH2017_21_RUC_O_A]MCC3543079.1 hypothetical protein [Microcoleus sp. PH2017_22_RUC_O_B]MCC3561610.1 hypothetical protein [Microcoleus sp. PH2017_27_LUM_O_A]TAE79504.1 MAG: hypothetical protein EAZ83_21245 [Oscillatoriales cyanobacterium]
MSIPKKGTRKIIVDGESFIWLIRRQPTYTQECFHGGNLHVAVEHAENSGSVLVIITDRPHPQNGSINHCEIPVRPSDVAQWIRQALQLGWQPTRSGIPFQVQIAGQCMEKI